MFFCLLVNYSQDIQTVKKIIGDEERHSGTYTCIAELIRTDYCFNCFDSDFYKNSMDFFFGF